MIVSKLSNISNFVRTTSLIPFNFMLYLAATASNHPHLLGRPVVAPNSFPKSCILAPTSSFNSVGKGPFPTLVTYALNNPMIDSK